MNAAKPTESSYVRALQTHRPADFSLLYDAYSPALYGYLLRLVNDPIQAQHLLQNAFTTIWSSSRQYDARQGSVFSWMLSLTRTLAMDILCTPPAEATAPLQCRADWLEPAVEAPLAGEQEQSVALKSRVRTGLLNLQKYLIPGMDLSVPTPRA
jgi:DNA-directed RNA polymerase specialized sigma24 family protein